MAFNYIIKYYSKDTLEKYYLSDKILKLELLRTQLLLSSLLPELS